MAADPSAGTKAGKLCRKHGLLMRPLGSCLTLSPPLTITDEHLELITESLTAALTDLERETASAASATAG